MKIRWLGHSAFLLEGKNVAVVTDPFHHSVGYKMPSVKADYVSISHNHHDHNYTKAVEGSPRIIFGEEPFENESLKVESIKAYHDKEKGSLRGEVFVYKFVIDGISICHLGDVGESYSKKFDKLAAVNIMLIPIGGNYTIAAKEAKEYIEAIRPNVVIPMHYLTKDCDIDIESAEHFLSLFEKKDIVCANSDTIEFHLSDFNNKDTKVVLLTINP